MADLDIVSNQAKLTPAAELADLSHDDLFVLAANGSAYAQEMMCHRILKTCRVSERVLEDAEMWASMAAARGHRLSDMTIAQICLARGAMAALAEQDESAVENLAQAIALFDRLAELGELYSVQALDIVLAGLKLKDCEEIQAAVLKRAKEIQGA